MVASACCFGSIPPLTVLATEHGMALQSIQAWRYATTAVLLVGFGLWKRSARSTVSDRLRLSPWFSPRMLLIAGSGQAAVATLSLAALRWMPAATASFLFYTYPAWVALIAVLRGTDSLDRTRMAALLLSFMGLSVMVGAPDAASLAPMGVAMILAAALVYALFIPLLGHLQTGRDPLDVARAIAVGGALCFVTWGLASGALLKVPAPVALLASLGQGVVSAGAFLGFLTGLRLLGSVRTAITSTVEPFWTSMLGVMLLGQQIGTGTVIGGVAIMGAVLMLQRPAGTRVPHTAA